MPKIKIDGVEMEVPAGITILQACELAGLEIRASAITSGCRSPATAACALSR